VVRHLAGLPGCSRSTRIDRETRMRTFPSIPRQSASPIARGRNPHGCARRSGRGARSTAPTAAATRRQRMTASRARRFDLQAQMSRRRPTTTGNWVHVDVLRHCENDRSCESSRHLAGSGDTNNGFPSRPQRRTPAGPICTEPPGTARMVHGTSRVWRSAVSSCRCRMSLSDQTTPSRVLSPGATSHRCQTAGGIPPGSDGWHSLV